MKNGRMEKKPVSRISSLKNIALVLMPFVLDPSDTGTTG